MKLYSYNVLFMIFFYNCKKIIEKALWAYNYLYVEKYS